ncbi:MAG TPA: glycosyltransferase family 39 protein [Chloroflexota bacterium]|nr:glycosyltransferase family 39 protein [Chloroflexota bacterium]
MIKGEGAFRPQRLALTRRYAPTSPSGRGDILALLPLLVLVPTVGFIAWRRFDGLYGQDSFAYFDYALGPLRSALAAREPLPPFFWPPGYPVLVALASALVGDLAGQEVSLLLGACVPLLTALLARELWPEQPRVPLVAGLLVALCGQLWQSSMVVMADTTGLAMATLSAWAIVRYARQPHLGWLLLASLAISVAMLSRWIYGLVAVPLALYVLALRPNAGHVVAASALAVLLLAAVLGPPLLGLVREHAAPAAFAGNLQVYSWWPGNALHTEFDTPDGHLSYTQPNGLYYALAPANLALFGPLLAPWIIVGLVVVALSWPKRALLVVVGWAAIVYAFHAGAPWQNFRFTLAYVPPLAILIAVGLSWVSWWLSARLAVVWLALGLAVMIFGGVRLLNGFIDRQQEERALVGWVESQVGPGARLLTFGPTLTFTHFSRLHTFDLSEVTDTELANPAPTYVLVDVTNVEDQWRGQRPADLYVRLRDGPGLEPLGTRGTLTLFHVELT